MLIAILNNRLDFALAQEQHWYRIPVSSARKWLQNRWPPAWIAFYQTKVFGSEAFSIRYYSRVVEIREVYRWQLFPDQPRDEKAKQRYYQLILGPLEVRTTPIVSNRLRRIVFISTSWRRFLEADEINDLFYDSPLEDTLWQQLKRLRIPAERQEFVTVKGQSYALDFAIYCAKGKLDVETDGDLYHIGSAHAQLDNLRNNTLATVGWDVIRFTTHQVKEQLADYCLPTIADNINRLGGLDEGKAAGRRVSIDPAAPSQSPLFDD